MRSFFVVALSLILLGSPALPMAQSSQPSAGAKARKELPARKPAASQKVNMDLNRDGKISSDERARFERLQNSRAGQTGTRAKPGAKTTAPGAKRTEGANLGSSARREILKSGQGKATKPIRR